MAIRVPSLGPRMRKVARYVGFVVVGLVAFVLALQLTFPFDRVKDKIIEALSEKYEVTIGSVEGGIMPGRVYFKAVSLRTRPATADEVPSTLYIEQLELDVGIVALLGGAAAVELDAKIGPGHIRGDIELSKSATRIDLVGEDLPSASLPVREVLGLPMSGKLQLAFAVDVPTEKLKNGKTGPDWTQAEGRVQLACPAGCTVGDGKSKLRPKLKNQRNQAFAEGGIDFGKVNIDKLAAVVELKDGKLRVTRFETKSPDGDLHVDFDMTLNQDMDQSQVTGCLRFRGSDALLKREAKTHAAISTTGAPLGPDNLFHIKLDGPLREVRRLGQTCGSGNAGGSGSPSNAGNPGGLSPAPERPNLTITPEQPVRIPPPPAEPPPQGPATPSPGSADAPNPADIPPPQIAPRPFVQPSQQTNPPPPFPETHVDLPPPAAPPPGEQLVPVAPQPEGTLQPQQ
jgi:type II secretion system protein N